MDEETPDFVLGFLAKHFHCYVEFIRHEGHDAALDIIVDDIRQSKNSMQCVLPWPICVPLVTSVCMLHFIRCLYYIYDIYVHEREGLHT